MINQILKDFELDEEAHKKGQCSFPCLALCSAEEHKAKRLLRSSLTRVLEDAFWAGYEQGDNIQISKKHLQPDMLSDLQQIISKLKQ